MHRPTFSFLHLIGWACVLAGTGTGPAAAAEAAGVAAESVVASLPVVENYVLQPGDLVRIQIFQEPDLDRELRVAQDATIMLPLIGAVPAGGRTVRAIEAEIAQRYDAEYLVNPQINLTVLAYAERHVNIMGHVAHPGPVMLPPEERMSLVDAIARAGGFTMFGDRRRVRLTRTAPDGQVLQHTIDTDEILQGRAEDPWLLQPNDNIYVPERRF